MWDTEHFQACPADKPCDQIQRPETHTYCNLLAHFAHIVAYSLFKGADDFVICTLFNHDCGWNSKADFMLFLNDMRQQALRYKTLDPALIVDPNFWFADKFWTII